LESNMQKIRTKDVDDWERREQVENNLRKGQPSHDNGGYDNRKKQPH